MRIRFPILMVLLLLAAAFGCAGKGPTSSDGGGDVISCSERKDCPGRLGCVGGVCGHCSRDRDCLLTEFCHPLERLCTLLPGQGDECVVNDDCPLGAFCVQGFCKAASEVTPCQTSAQCSSGQRCDPVNLVCVQDLGCNRDEDCATGEVCDLSNNRCQRACTPETQDLICGHGQVCDQLGRCVECFRDDQCGVGLHCNLEKYHCEGQNSCLTTRDCNLGQVCNPQTLQCTTPPPTCLSNSDCPTGSICDPTEGICVSQDCQPDRLEPNNDPAAASPLTIGRIDDLNLCPGDRDWFFMPLSRGDRLLAIVNTDFLSADHFQTVLFDPAAQQVLQEDSLMIDATVTQDGNYLLRAQTTDPEAGYGLIVTVSSGIPCDDDAFEPNESALQATTLSPGFYQSLAICPRNEDWFAVLRPLDQRLEVRIDFNALLGALNLDLIAGDGQTLVMRSATAGNSQMVYADLQPGARFYLRVHSDGKTSNRYDMQISLRPQQGG